MIVRGFDNLDEYERKLKIMESKVRVVEYHRHNLPPSPPSLFHSTRVVVVLPSLVVKALNKVS